MPTTTLSPTMVPVNALTDAEIAAVLRKPYVRRTLLASLAGPDPAPGWTARDGRPYGWTEAYALLRRLEREAMPMA